RLRDLALDLVDRGCQLLRGRRNVTHVDGGVARSRGSAGGALRGLVGGGCKRIRRRSHLIGNRRERRQRGFDIGREVSDLGSGGSLALRTRAVGGRTTPLFAASQTIDKARDRARKRADLVAVLLAGYLTGHRGALLIGRNRRGQAGYAVLGLPDRDRAD